MTNLNCPFKYGITKKMTANITPLISPSFLPTSIVASLASFATFFTPRRHFPNGESPSDRRGDEFYGKFLSRERFCYCFVYDAAPSRAFAFPFSILVRARTNFLGRAHHHVAHVGRWCMRRWSWQLYSSLSKIKVGIFFWTVRQTSERHLIKKRVKIVSSETFYGS